MARQFIKVGDIVEATAHYKGVAPGNQGKVVRVGEHWVDVEFNLEGYDEDHFHTMYANESTTWEVKLVKSKAEQDAEEADAKKVYYVLYRKKAEHAREGSKRKVKLCFGPDGKTHAMTKKQAEEQAASQNRSHSQFTYIVVESAEGLV